MSITLSFNVLDNKSQEFIYQYLPNLIYRQFLNSVDRNRLILIDELFQINSFNVLKKAFQNLSIARLGQNRYIITYNKNLLINGRKLDQLLSIIQYGNRSVQGYSIFNDILNFIANNIEDIYEDYKSGNSIL